MKKLLKLLIISMLVLSFVFSAVACGGGGEGNGDNSQGSNTPVAGGLVEPAVDPIAERVTYQGTHVYTAPEVETEDYIVKNGEFLYDIIIPETLTNYITTQRTEFTNLIKRTLGVSVKFLKDSEVNVFDENAKYISIGDTTYLQKSGYQYDKDELGPNGYRIKTIGKNIFFVGGFHFGPLNAIYGFFKICFNYEQFNRNTLKIDTDVENVKLRNFDVVDIPDIPYFATYHKDLSNSKQPNEYDLIALRTKNVDDATVKSEIANIETRMHTGSGINALFHVPKDVNGSGSAIHNTLRIFDSRKQAFKDNPYSGYFLASSQHQICWTAGGNPDAYEAMIDFCFEQIKPELIRYYANPSLNRIIIANEDGGGHCGCDSCTESMKEAGGSWQGQQFRFANLLLQKIRDWMDKPENALYKKPFGVYVLAYDRYQTPPATFNAEENKYEAVPGFEPIDGIGVSNTTYVSYRSIYDEQEKWVRDNIKAYADLGCDIMTYNYTMAYNMATFNDFLTQYNSEVMQFFAAGKTEILFNELLGSSDPFQWSDLALYIISELAWNTNLNASELVVDYCDAVFGMISNEMQDILHEERLLFQFMQQQYVLDNSGAMWQQNSQTLSEQQYTFGVLKMLLNKVYAVWDKIEVYKEIDNDYYRLLKERVDLNTAHIFNTVVRIYSAFVDPPITAEEKSVIKNFLIEFCNSHTIYKGFNLGVIQSW